MLRSITIALSLFIFVSLARADEVLFKDGERLTGKIDTFDGTKLTITSPAAGKVTVDMKKVKTFASDGPIDVVLTGGSVVHQRIMAGPDGQITLAPGGTLQQQSIPLANIKKINPPPVKWTGNVVIGGILARGNTQTENLNAATHLVRRSDQDRISLDAQYLYGREKIIGDGNHETQNNWYIEGKYDYFFTPRFYGYADARVERDVIAGISLRLTPGAGIGYQWVDKPNFGFNTEAGAAWLYRSYSHDGSVDSASARLAYHLTAKLNDKVAAFHNFEYYPAFDRISNYFFDTDAGIRATLTQQMFAEFKVEERYDSQPAPGRGRNDTRFIVGVGWNF